MNPEDEQYQEQPIYQDNGQEYYEGEPVYEERVQPMVDMSVLNMPFWLRITLLCTILAILGGVVLLRNSAQYQGFQMSQLDAPESNTWVQNESVLVTPEPSTLPSPVDYPLEPNYTPPTTASWFYSNKANLKFILPDGWMEVSADSVFSPPGIEDHLFVLMQPETGCVISGADFDRGAANYVQTTFGERVFSGISQFDGNWFTNQAFHEKGIEFSQYERQFLSHELRHTYNLSDIDLLLWHNESKPVPVSCDKDFVSFLQSTDYHFLVKQPESYIPGDIYIRAVRPRLGEAETKLLFKSRTDGNTYELSTLGEGIFSTKAYLVENVLYYLGSDEAGSQLYYYDLSQNSGGALFDRGGFDQNPLIADFFVTNEHIYYLSGYDDMRRCIDGYHRDCSLTLYRLGRVGVAVSELLASSTPATSFVGYSDDQDALFMYTGYGDAGCVGLQLYIYENNIMSKGAELSGCIEDMGNDIPGEDFENYEREMSKLKAEVEPPLAKAIYSAYGSYSPSDTEVPTYYKIYFVE